MEDSQEKINYTGKAVKGAGYFRKFMCFHTINISTNNLNGKVIIEGTYNHNPSEEDWFLIYEKDYETKNYNIEQNIINEYFNFTSNAVLFRARLDRSYLNIDTSVSPENYTAEIGNVVKIQISY